MTDRRQGQLELDLTGERPDPPAAQHLPPDEEGRARIRDDLASTLFVEAGAGAGKTTSLVERIVNLVLAGVPITGIAAITFTEKAAGELRTRLRARLSALGSPQVSSALAELDHAPLGTLHAFARRLLFEYPIEAGVPPGFTVLDELESGLEFEEQWDDLLDRLLGDPDPPGGAHEGGRRFVELCEFDGFGIRRGVRRIADDFRANWDLVAERVELDPPDPLGIDCARVLEAGAIVTSFTPPPDDRQAGTVAELADWLERLAEAKGRTLLDLLVEHERRFATWATGTNPGGNKAKWRHHGGGEALDELRHAEQQLAARTIELLDGVRQHRRLLLGAVLGRFVLDAARQRAAAGRLEFHDLLVLARKLLATRPDVRATLHDRYVRVLLDEFQDTDPIQLEIAVRLTARPDDTAQDGDWRHLHPVAGRLFIVGDPKQSIYRFRRADIAQYLRAADQVGADRVVLSANFRSTNAVIDFTNHVFDRLIRHEPDAQPHFQPLAASRSPRLLGHGTVRLLGVERHDDLDGRVADELREREAADVAAAVTTALAERWPVVDERSGELRPCRPGDIGVLLPTRISLPALERALGEHGVPYRAENASVVYTTSEVRELLLAMRAADDPTDHLALVEALRTPLYGCSDVELWQWRRAGGSWSVWADPPAEMAGHPVADALSHLRSVAERIGWVAPADLLAAIADERRMFDLALSRPDARDVWRRLRYVIDQARAWSDAGGHGVRRYLAWAFLQGGEGRVADTILPEHDHDAVSVMTVHAAKGLEFPITVVAGLTTRPRRSPTTGVVWAAGTWMLAGKGDDGVFVEHQPLDEQMGDAERRRLLYVACTRAQDHLVVSLHRHRDADGGDQSDWSSLSAAELLAVGGSAAPSAGAVPLQPRPRSVAPPPVETLRLDWSDPRRWAAERQRALTSASRRSTVAATRLAADALPEPDEPVDSESDAESGDGIVDVASDPGLDKAPVDVDLPPWQRGRYGTAVGRAVHGVLQFCDVDTGADIEALARSQCAAEGVLGLDDDVAALVRSALRSPIVRQVAAGATHWRELFVAAPVGGRLVEGYVDLLVRTPAGLVVVDYKTDQWSGPVEAERRTARYRIQLAAYAAALEAVLREPIAAGLLVRCRAHRPAEQIDVPRWDEALTEVRRLLA